MHARQQIIHPIDSVVLHVPLLDLLFESLQLPDPRHRHFVLVSDQRPIKMYCESQKHKQNGHENDASRPRCSFVDVVKLDPTKNGDLGQEQQQTEQSGERPRGLNVPVQPLVGRLVHEPYSVQTADRLDIGQNTSAYHQG